MIAATVPFRAAHFAREVRLRKLEAEVRAERLPVQLADVMSAVHAVRLVPARPVVSFKPWRL